MIDPYKILHVGRKATPEQIKRAYRRAARKSHPDSGGSNEAFEQVNAAYRCLSDPARRQHYDATGDMGSDVPDNSTGMMLTVITGAFCAVVNEFIKQGADPTREDVLTHVRNCIVQGQKEAVENLKQGQKSRQLLASMQARFTTEEPENLLEAMVAGQLAQVDRQLAKVQEEQEYRKRALEFLTKYRYRWEQQMRVMMATNTATTAGTWGFR